MKLIKEVTQEQVWEHWKNVEKLTGDKFRWDIRKDLVEHYDMRWFLAETEKEDLENMFIISSDDWRVITKTFRLLETVKEFQLDVNEKRIEDIPVERLKKVCDIQAKKLIYEENINGLDRKLILVSPSHTGNFTIIEGNKRAVALLSMNKLVGNQIYLGISKQILRYLWARYSK